MKPIVLSLFIFFCTSTFYPSHTQCTLQRRFRFFKRKKFMDIFLSTVDDFHGLWSW